MESLDANVIKENTNFLTSEIRIYLTETVKWGRFLAIMGYIGIGLMLLVGVVFLVVAISGGASYANGFGGFGAGFISLIYLAIAALYYFPVNYLYQFSRKIKQGLVSSDVDSLNDGFENLKSLFKFMGIVAVVILSMYALLLLVGIVAGLINLF